VNLFTQGQADLAVGWERIETRSSVK